MILVIDTSSATSALALLDASRTAVREATYPSGRTFDLPAAFRDLAGSEALTAVAVATGPGSFTGLRAGVSFGLGLAMGLRIPIFPLSSLGLQSARSDGPVLAVAEAGRGRVYFLAPGGEEGLAEPGDLPKDLSVVGWLRPATEAALSAAGLRLKPEGELRSFGSAASRVLGSADEVSYGSLRLKYMQSFSAPRA
ncbi:MAG TPA: tRNA (adenosine(37)-N6)-threonylcarbamoyltransferase complex dimerization subunit type 1 TsaB [Candidatus Dormibacteraeota bacterium]|nr:tRNA (adenosine(37)-N6)-threonylcarbamoyltransferase complex dimerization subunit type 1 TsaB [Candidatus Dormibacteraeota bacterium]